VSHNASAVKNYNGTSSLVRFENENIFFYFKKQLFPTTTPAMLLQILKDLEKARH
jgi:hypothetical protein